MRPTHFDGIHFLMLAILGAVGPVVGIYLAFFLRRRVRPELATMIAIPLEAILAAVSVGLPVIVIGIRPALPIILGASTAGVAGEGLILLFGLTRPAWQSPAGFPVLAPKGDAKARENVKDA
jgi:hypothetical protein